MIAPERNPPWKKMKRDEHTGLVELRLKRWREKFPLQSNGEEKMQEKRKESFRTARSSNQWTCSHEGMMRERKKRERFCVRGRGLKSQNKRRMKCDVTCGDRESRKGTREKKEREGTFVMVGLNSWVLWTRIYRTTLASFFLFLFHSSQSLCPSSMPLLAFEPLTTLSASLFSFFPSYPLLLILSILIHDV